MIGPGGGTRQTLGGLASQGVLGEPRGPGKALVLGDMEWLPPEEAGLCSLLMPGCDPATATDTQLATVLSGSGEKATGGTVLPRQMRHATTWGYSYQASGSSWPLGGSRGVAWELTSSSWPYAAPQDPQKAEGIPEAGHRRRCRIRAPSGS